LLPPQQQDAALALGVFYLESGSQCADKVVPYLISLAEALDNACVQKKRGANESKSCLETF